MTTKTQTEIQAKHSDRQRKRGLCAVRVWIPEDKRDELRELAAKWRAES